MLRFRLRHFLPVLALIATAAPGPVPAPRFTKLFELKPSEGVFAYARISPDGKTLAYASEAPMKLPPGTKFMGSPPVTMTETVIDLPTKKVLFTDPGIDAYWSLDGERMIWSSNKDGVAIRHLSTGAISKQIVPGNLGDYYSWGIRDGKNLILTITSHYYYLDGDKGVLPAATVQSCPGIGVGDRPLLSKDGMKITTFVRGAVVVRDLTDCNNILNTGLQGAKADFSFDGRYIAFDVLKASKTGREIVVIDLQKKTVRHVTNLPGSSFFPSWTKDGRLCFRYDAPTYRGFMMIDDVLSAPEKPLPAVAFQIPAERSWTDIFPETARPDHRYNVVLIWATWSAHSHIALDAMQEAGEYFKKNALDVAVAMTPDPESLEPDVTRMIKAYGITLRRIPLSPDRLHLTEALNQSPTTLLFRDGKLVDRRLGAQTADELKAWVASVAR